MNSYIKWSGLAIQMGVSIGGCTWLGIYLDKQTGWRFPVWTLVLAILGVVTSIVMVVRGVQSMDKDS